MVLPPSESNRFDYDVVDYEDAEDDAVFGGGGGRPNDDEDRRRR